MGDVYMNVMRVRKRRCSCDEALVADRRMLAQCGERVPFASRAMG
jgi:hypothetical protein